MMIYLVRQYIGEKMQTARVEFEIEIPDDVTNDQLYDWLRFELGENGRLDGTNPLTKTELKSKNFSLYSEIIYE